MGSGCRWRDCPPEYGPSTTIYNRYNRWSAQGLWRGSPLRGWAKKGEAAQAIGRSRGGRTSKIHALANAQGKPIAFVLTPGNVADITVAATLLDDIAPLFKRGATSSRWRIIP